MPAASKYETVIKPNFERIRELKLGGATDKDIYTALEVSSAVWYKNKKEYQELRDILNNKEVIDENLDKAQEILDNLPTKEMYKQKIAEASFFNENASLDAILKGLRQLYPEDNHYLQLKRDELAIEKEKIEKGIANPPNVTIINDGITRNGGS